MRRGARDMTLRGWRFAVLLACGFFSKKPL